MHDPQDKDWWVIEGQQRERRFVEQMCPHLNLSAQINPEKRHNKYAPDLIVEGRLADLKAVTTPFYKADELYAIDPQFAYSFNGKDYERYQEDYPHIDIYIWVHWQETERQIGQEVYRVKPMFGIWRSPFQTLREMIENGKAPLHPYGHRGDDKQGNAKDSFIFDLRVFECLYQNGPESSKAERISALI